MANPARVVASAADEMSTTISIESTIVYVPGHRSSAMTRLRVGRGREDRPLGHLTPGGNLPTMIVGTSSSLSSSQAASPSGPKASGIGGSSGGRVPT